MSNTVITIGRQFGSGGREIGKKLSEKLEIPFYDKELLTIAAKESGISEELFETNDEKPTSSLLYSLSTNPYGVGGYSAMTDMPLNNKLFLAQFEAVQKLAQQGSCIIVGRCADYALRNHPQAINVFIHADLAARVKRLMRTEKLTEPQAKEQALKIDKKRASYYNSYTGKKWGNIDSYHLTVDSGVVGIDGAVKIIEDFAALRASYQGAI